MANKEALQEFTINFDLDLSNIQEATKAVEKEITAINSQYLPDLENMLNEITNSMGDLVDTSELNTLIENIKNGVEVGTGEVEKVSENAFNAIAEFMEQSGYLWDEHAKSWVVAVKNASDEIEATIKDIDLSDLEDLLEQIKELSNGEFDTSEFEAALERIRNGADLTADEIIELKEKMNKALDEVKKKAEQLDRLKTIFGNVKSWFNDFLMIGGGFGGFAIGNQIADWVQSVFADKGKKNGIFSEKDLRLTEQYQKSLTKINEVLEKIQKVIARFLLPVFTALAVNIEKVINFVVKHQKLILMFLAGLGIALSGILKTQLAILATQLKIIAPYIAIAAAVAAIVAIIEDIYYYFMGWDSVTGDLVEKFPLLGTALEIIRPLIMGIFHTIEAIIDFFKNPSLDNFIRIFDTLADTIAFQAKKIFDIFADAFSEIGEAWNNIDWSETFKQLFAVDWWLAQIEKLKKWFLELWDSVVSYFKDIFLKVIDFLTEKITNILKPIKDIGKNIGEKVQSVKDKATGLFDNAKGFFGFNKDTTPIIPNYATTNTNTTFNNDMKFTLNGVDEKTAKTMSDDISKKLYQIQTQTADKGRF